MMSNPQRKAWSNESMKAATESVLNEGRSIREAARLYNVPFETLRRRVNGSVEEGCRPGPSTVLTDDEEDQLERYLIQMSEMGFGLSREAVMHLAYTIVEKSQRKHPFKDETAGRAWFDGFRRRHPNLTIRQPQPLSYCRALCSNRQTVSDFFGKLGAIYGMLNLIAKPMCVLNADETNVTIVHKPGKVIAELGQRNVYAVTSGERGKTHTVLSCVSASGYTLPPMIVYPRKKQIPENFKDGAMPNTLFAISPSGWMNSDLFVEWFKFLMNNIPPSRPILLILDGHGSHISIEVIELARANNIHLLCLPAHTTHLLQPLDVGVFKSFKTYFSKACGKYLVAHPGRVVTNDKLASLIAEAYPNSFTMVNILSGFKKCGVFPFNPGEVTDRQLAPSKAVGKQHNVASDSSDCRPEEVAPSNFSPPLFSAEKESLYRKRFEEGYNVSDPEYIAWLRINHPEFDVSGTFSDSSSLASSKKHSSCASDKQSSDLSDILVLPKPVETVKSAGKERKKTGLNTNKTVCITEDGVLEKLKEDKQLKAEAERAKEVKRFERQQKKKAREEEKKAAKKLREEKKLEKEIAKKLKDRQRSTRKSTRLRGKGSAAVESESGDRPVAVESESDQESEDEPSIVDPFAKIQLDRSDSSETESDAVCPKCGLIYSESGGLWVNCDKCGHWYDLKCANLKKKSIPDYFYCQDCVTHNPCADS